MRRPRNSRPKIEAETEFGNNCIDGEVGSEIRYNEESPAAEKVDTMGKVQEVILALVKCQRLCEDTSHKVIRQGECGDNIQEMKEEFAKMIEIVEIVALVL